MSKPTAVRPRPSRTASSARSSPATLPSRRIYEDDHAVAFLDIARLAPRAHPGGAGRHVADLITGDPSLAEIARPIDAVARMLMHRLAADGINMLLLGRRRSPARRSSTCTCTWCPRYADEPGLDLLINRGVGARRRAGRGLPADPGGRVSLRAGPPHCRTSRRLGRLAVEFAAAVRWSRCCILPFVIQYGKLWPWQPSTIDLQVYVYAVKDMLAGKDIFATTTPFWNLYFIYPPIAAVLMTPLAFGPYVFWQVVWTAGLVWAQQSVLRRCGVPRGWKLGLIGIAVVLAVEPIRTTLGYGQVNTMLMALVVADLLPDAPGERRRIPQGTLIGLAAAIKLTPALFVVFAFLIGKRRAAVTAVISFAAFTAIGAILLFSETVRFFGGLSGGDTRTASPLYAGNQSLLGVFFRLRRLLARHHPDRAGHRRHRRPARCAGRGALVAGGAEGVRGRAGRAVHLPGLAAVLDPPLRLDPAAGGGRVWPRAAHAGPGCSAAFWVVWVCVCLPLAVLPYGGGRERHFDVAAAAGGQPRAGARRRPGRRPGLAAGDHHPIRRGWSAPAVRTPTPSPDRSTPRRLDGMRHIESAVRLTPCRD